MRAMQGSSADQSSRSHSRRPDRTPMRRRPARRLRECPGVEVRGWLTAIRGTTPFWRAGNDTSSAGTVVPTNSSGAGNDRRLRPSTISGHEWRLRPTWLGGLAKGDKLDFAASIRSIVIGMIASPHRVQRLHGHEVRAAFPDRCGAHPRTYVERRRQRRRCRGFHSDAFGLTTLNSEDLVG